MADNYVLAKPLPRMTEILHGVMAMANTRQIAREDKLEREYKRIARAHDWKRTTNSALGLGLAPWTYGRFGTIAESIIGHCTRTPGLEVSVYTVSLRTGRKIKEKVREIIVESGFVLADVWDLSSGDHIIIRHPDRPSERLGNVRFYNVRHAPSSSTHTLIYREPWLPLDISTQVYVPKQPAPAL